MLYIPFHAFFSVALGTASDWPLVFKAWKEVFLLILVCLAAWLLLSDQKLMIRFLRSLINRLAIFFVSLHLILVFLLPGDILASLAGLAIDTRFVLFFLLVRLAILYQPKLPVLAIKTLGISGIFVIGFGLLQQFVLPADILSYVGYSRETIAPYLTVDNNQNFIRINSMLRGPNPLGAYAMILITILAAFTITNWTRLKNHSHILLILAAASTLSVLIASYSRSAWLGLGVAGAVVVVLSAAKNLRLPLLMAGLVGILLVGGAYIAVKDSSFVQTVIEHKDPNDPVGDDSNLGHINSLLDGTRRVASQPLGAGVGSTGSASLFTGKPVIIENQYLFVAHESGWLGIGIFIALLAAITLGLWRRIGDWFALATLASGVGLIVIGLLQPVFVDDTIAYIWWGMAAIALGVYNKDLNRKLKTKT